MLNDSVPSDAAHQLHRGAADLGLTLSAHQEAQLLHYARLLLQWGKTFNLTSILSPSEIITTHLLDSLSIVPLIAARAPRTLLDIGSGAGLPGIPLAIALPHLAVTTVDAVRKKIAFQTQVKGSLKLLNCSPVHARVQALTFEQPFDMAVTRAFSSLADAVSLAAPLLAADGLLLAMKGRLDGQELGALPNAWPVRLIEPLHVPGLAAERCAVLLARAFAPSFVE